MIRMQINGQDSETIYGFKYLRREIGSPTYGIYGREWPKNALRPILGDRRVRYAPMQVILLYEGSEQLYEDAKSRLLRDIADSTITFSDLDFFFDVSLESSETEKFRGTKYRELTLDLDIYAKYKAEITETANRVSSRQLNVPATAETPAIIEITPSVDLIDIVISGFGETFTVKNLATGQKVIVNGEDCIVTQAGANKYSDYIGWGFPVLHPEINALTFSQTSADITIKYKPRWL